MCFCQLTKFDVHFKILKLLDLAKQCPMDSLANAHKLHNAIAGAQMFMVDHGFVLPVTLLGK